MRNGGLGISPNQTMIIRPGVSSIFVPDGLMAWSDRTINLSTMIRTSSLRQGSLLVVAGGNRGCRGMLGENYEDSLEDDSSVEGPLLLVPWELGASIDKSLRTFVELLFDTWIIRTLILDS